MRVSAVGWFFDPLEETERVAAISSAITHKHPEGIKGAQATAAAIWMARNGKDKEEIRDYIEKTYGYDLRKTYEYWHPIYHWESSCQGTVPQAIIAFLDSTDFEDAIRKAVSLGGDSDTLACITGGIAEAYYKEIPKHMAERTMRIFPQIFNDVLEGIRKETVYGDICRIIG
jgi:ADP-ribosylglycohydrolase